MQSKLICEEFERKMWQFMDSDLPDEEMVFWKEHLKECALCSTQLQEAGEAISVYESIPMEDLEEETFDRMLNKALRKNRLKRAISEIPGYFHELSSPRGLKKLALGGLAFSAVVIILFFMYKPENINPGKTISPPARTESSPAGISGNSLAENTAASSGVEREVRKSEAVPVKYEWHDKSTASAIRHMGRSITAVRIKKEKHIKLDSWILQAIAIRRKMEWVRTDLDKSAM